MHVLKRLIPIVLIAALITVYFLYEKARTTPNPNEIETSGYIEGHEVRIAGLYGGRLINIDVTEGQQIKKDDAVAEFDAEQLKLKRNELEAVLKGAESRYDKLVNGATSEELSATYQAYLSAQSKVDRLKEGYRKEDIEPLRKQLDGAEAAFDKAKKDFQRISDLYDAEVVSRMEFDAANAAVDVAESNRDALSAQIEQMQIGYPTDEIEAAQHQAKSMYDQYANLKKGARSEDIAAAEAELERINASIAQVDQQLSEAKVVSPRDGTIRDVPLRVGDVVPPGAPVAVLVENNDMWVEIYVPSFRLGAISLGMNGYIIPDSMPDERFEADITYISPEGEFTPRNIQTKEDRVKQVFKLKLTIKQTDPRLKPGMGCSVVIPLNGE